MEVVSGVDLPVMSLGRVKCSQCSRIGTSSKFGVVCLWCRSAYKGTCCHGFTLWRVNDVAIDCVVQIGKGTSE